MPMASYAVTNFLGGEISQFAQGRFDRPDYRISLNVCLNAFPVEIGPWTRRPGTAHAGTTRGGGSGRVMEYDFEQAEPITMEFTDGWLRFRNGIVLITTNDAQSVSAVSTANPAVVQTASAHGWSTGNTVILPGASTPLLENRQFTITVVDTTHFSIADALTGTNIDGSTLGTLASGATVERVHELQTSYIAGSWSTLRAVQAETTNILLNGSIVPQAITVTTEPASGVNPQFAINAATFNDGPYLDPPTNGALLTPSAGIGIITLSVSFPVYNSSQSYAKGSFVTSSSVNYQSLVDQNVGNAPASSPSDWAAVSAGAAINNGQGFLSTDVGRLIRLFSEPAAWASGSTYSSGAVVSYNPTGLPGGSTYWQSLVGSNTGNVPGADLTHWELVTTNGAAIWSWGKIVSLSAQIPSAPSGVAYIGNMTEGGGLSSAFDSNTTKGMSSSAADLFTFISSNSFDVTTYVGENFGGCSTTSYKIANATIFPTTDLGFAQYAAVGGSTNDFEAFITLEAFLYASNTLPTGPLNGTLLGSTVIGGLTMDNGTSLSLTIGKAAVTIQSSDTSTSYQYLWVVLFSAVTNPQTVAFNVEHGIAQVHFVQAEGGGSSATAVNVEILGPSLLYTSAIQTWRLGAYSNTTGYPTCGCYADGRIWLGGAIDNRFDACVSNGISGSTIDFAPTDQFGVVADNAAISATLNSDSVNPILWMKPDLQGVLIGTQDGEFLVQAPTAGPITPTNISARRATRIGGAFVEPVRTEHTLVFVKRFGRKLMEYFADVFSGKFTAPNIADKAEHITLNTVAELAYTDATTPIIWGRDNSGGMFGITYKRDTLMSSQGPTYAAFHRHQLGTGRLVTSLCSGASVGGNLDALTIVTSDGGGTSNHVEVLTGAPTELSPLTSSWFLDDAVNPTSVSISTTAQSGAPNGGLTLNGLWHLNGKTVQVFAGGLDCGNVGDISASPSDFTVSNGSVYVPFGDGVSSGPGAGLFTALFAKALALSQIVVGCTYNSDGQIVRPQMPAETGARTGPAFSKLQRNHFFGVQLVNTLGISFGTTFDDLTSARFTESDEHTAIAPLTMYSGTYTDTIDDDYSRFGNAPCWRVSRPLPATVVVIGGSIETMDQ